MATYTSGEKTRENLLSSARELFFRHGLENVSDVDICRHASVQRGLVGYHFGNREGLILEIYQQFVVALRSAIDRKFPTDDPVLAYCILERMLVSLLNTNSNMRRFYLDIIAYPSISDAEVRIQDEQFRSIFRDRTGAEDEQQIRLAVVMTQGTFNELIRCIGTGYLKHDIASIMKADLAIILSIVGLSPEESKTVVDEVYRLTGDWRVSVGRTFKPRIVRA